MNLEELLVKINELELRFEALRDNMTMFQDNINNNIYWFYSAIGIMVAFLGAVGVALYFLVQTAVNKGIEKGIEKTNNKIETLIRESHQFHWSTGISIVMNKQFQVVLPELISDGLISFDVKDKNGLYLEKVVQVDDKGVIIVDVPQMQHNGQVEWAALWVPKKLFTR